MLQKKIIGLIGAKAAGKTTAFNVINVTITNVTEVTLAGKLKSVCAEVFDIPYDHFNSHRYKEAELDNLVYLNSENLAEVLKAYGIKVSQALYKKHIGKILTTPRQIAQYIGTEVLRSIEPDIHCTSAIAGKENRDILVVTDMRFPNEFDFFANQKDAEFLSLYIQNTRAELVSEADGHASEAHTKALGKKADVTITNNGTLHTFEEAVCNFAKGLINA